MTREVLSASLTALAAEINRIRRQDMHLMFTMSSAADIREIDENEFASDNDRGIAELMREHRASSIGRRNNLKGLRASLERVGAALAKDKIAWEAERGTYENVVEVLGSIGRRSGDAAVVVPAALVEPEPEIEADARAFKPSTLLSVAGRATLDARKAALNSDDSDGSRYEERLETAFAAFLEVVGDKPLTYYLPIHMQDFATFLSRVPKNRSKVLRSDRPVTDSNRSKIALFKGLTLKQTVETNGRLPPDQRKPCLSETTVASYLSEVKNIWSQVSAGVPGLRDMGAYRVSMPKDAAASIDREPLAVSSLNVWLRDAATPKLLKKPHMAAVGRVAHWNAAGGTGLSPADRHRRRRG